MKNIALLSVLLTLALGVLGCERNEKSAATEAARAPVVQNESQNDGVTNEEITQPTVRPGFYQVRFFPGNPTVAEPLTVLIKEAKNIQAYRWERNGVLIPGATHNQLAADQFSKHDNIAVTITAANGEVRAETKISNAQPRVSEVQVINRQVQNGEEIELFPEGEDADQDLLEYRYAWFFNNVAQPEIKESVFLATQLKRGDKIRYIVTPFDGEAEGFIYKGSFQVSNVAPRFISRPPETITGSEYRYLASAQDPDGDTLTYSLSQAPPGMTINPATGEITLSIGPNLNGTFPVKVQAEDDQGKMGTQEFSVVISN